MSEAALKQQFNKQPKTKRAKRALAEKAPKTIENDKKQLLLRGSKTSPIINEVLKDLHVIKKPNSVSLMRRNEKRPFEDFSSVTFLSDKNDCSLFAFGSNSKKRPNNIILGRTFDYELLDMYEFGVNGATYQSIDSFTKPIDYKSNTEEQKNKTFNYGSKPALLFQGDLFQNNPLLKDLKVFFLDYFNGHLIKRFNLNTLDHVIVFTAINEDDPCILFRHYKIEYQSSAHNKLPYVHLSEIGPSMDLTLRRYDGGNDELIKKSKQNVNHLLNLKPKQKNVFLDKLFKGRKGRIFVDQNEQNLNKFKMNRKKMKSLRDRDRKKNGGMKKKKNSNNKKNRMKMNQF